LKLYNFLNNYQNLINLFQSIDNLITNIKKKYQLDKQAFSSSTSIQEIIPVATSKRKKLRNKLISPIYDKEGVLDDSFNLKVVRYLLFI